MKLTKRQFEKLIKECACEAMKDAGMGMGGLGLPPPPLPPLPKMVKVIKLGKLGGLGGGHHDEHDDYDHDDQGEKSMIMANLARMSERAQELHDMAADVDDNEEWVQEKIAVASAMIDSIYNYLKYRDEE